MARDWIHGFFDATYVRILRAQWPDAVTRKQVAFVAKVAGLRRGARVLDVPCGFGRHARLLARRGMLVVGVDLSRAMIAEARRGGSQPGLLFVRADMRRLPYQGEFDAALNLYTSFGYFSPRENLDVLRRMARALKPGGRIIIDHRDRDRDVKLPGRWWDRAHDGTLAIHEMKLDRHTNRWSGEWTVVSPGGRRSVRAIRHYVYTLDEWKRMFHAAGLRLTGAWSNYGEPYHAGRGPRLIIAGTKPLSRSASVFAPRTPAPRGR
jgi:SAM-dependent methyltransferase